MEWLGIIIIIAVSVFNSLKESNKAKQQREQRQQVDGPTIYRSESGSVPTVSARKTADSKKEGDLLGKLSHFMDEVTNMLNTDDATGEAKPVKTKQIGKTTGKKKKKNTAAQPEKKSPSELPRQTLMEQRPDREQRDAYKKVSASVKPLKNAFDNQEQCDHRVVLNPNIQYSSQNQKIAAKQTVAVRTDSEALIQGMIWSEILGKPKAYQRRENKFQR